MNSEDTTLKIFPANQSLILAGEPGGSGGGRTSLLGQASQLVAGGGSLKRMTILAAHADAAVVVQADYYSPHDAAMLDVQLPALEQRPAAMALPATITATSSRPPDISSYWNPIRLYLRTQGNLDHQRRPALLDVLA